MSIKHVTRGVILMHSISLTIRPHAERTVSSVLGYDVWFEWTAQPALPSVSRAGASWAGDIGTDVMPVSVLGGWEHLRFGVTEGRTAVSEGRRWSATPGLGIFYVQTDLMGNVVVPENQVRVAIDQAGGDAHEMRRSPNLASGQARDDELGPFRYAGADAPIRWLCRVG